MALVQDVDVRPGVMSVEVLTNWEDGKGLFYDAFGWYVEERENELLAVRTGTTHDDSVRLVRVSLQTHSGGGGSRRFGLGIE